MTDKHDKIEDLIIPLSDYPHMPYWGTLREAIAQLNVAYETGHHTVLVFDEGYKLVGMLSRRNILKGLVPKSANQYSEGIPIFWDALLASGTEEQLALPIKDFMSKVKSSMDPKDGLLKAAYILLEENTVVIPVMEAEKVVGVVRMDDIFHEITNVVLKL